MAYIVSYQKYITREITRDLIFPTDDNHLRIGTELLTFNGITYACFPDDAIIPSEQPSEIVASIQNPATISDELKEILKANCRHVELIEERVIEKIRERYSLTDEIKFVRMNSTDEAAIYNAYVESCRAWGRAEKAKLGF